MGSLWFCPKTSFGLQKSAVTADDLHLIYRKRTGLSIAELQSIFYDKGIRRRIGWKQCEEVLRRKSLFCTGGSALGKQGDAGN